MDMGLNPVGKLLGEGGFCEGIIAGSQSYHKNLDFSDLSGIGGRDLHGLPGIVNKEFFSGQCLSSWQFAGLKPLFHNEVEEPLLFCAQIISF